MIEGRITMHAMKKPFPASLTFGFLMCLILGGVTAGAFAVLKPTGSEIDNSQLLAAMKIAGWAAGPVAGILSFIVICILNVIRRIIRMRKIGWMHPIVILIGIGFWLVVSWSILNEHRYTDFAVGIQDFVARPLLWGSLVATLMTIVFSIPLVISRKK